MSQEPEGLKSCPFCGGEECDALRVMARTYRAGCRSCGAHVLGDTMIEAYAAWNRRSPPLEGGGGQGSSTTGLPCAQEHTQAQHSAGWVDLIAAEFAKPQFMTTTTGPGHSPGTRRYSVEFTFVGRNGAEAEAARDARDALEDAFRAAGRAINGDAQ